MKKSMEIKLILLIVLLLAGCTNQMDNNNKPVVNEANVYPITNEQITLSMYITPSDHVIDIHTNEAILWLEEFTNIDLELIVGPHNNDDGKIDLLLASGKELPDVIFTNDGLTSEQLSIYGEKGLLLPLNDYIDEYAPNLKKAIEYNPMILNQITMSDGNIYSFARYNEEQHVLYSQKMWINKTWLDELALEIPVTIEEFYQVLVAFKNSDCNGNGIPDEIPFSGMTDRWRTDLYGFIMQPFVPVSESDDLWMTIDESGAIAASVLEPGFRLGIEFLRQLYIEGLLDENVFILESESIKQLTENETGNRVGAIQAGGLATVVDLSKTGARDDFVALEPLMTIEDGSRRTPYFRSDARNVFSISADCENIEAAVRLGDLLMINPFEPGGEQLEVGLNVWYGPNGWKKPEDGSLGLNGSLAWYEWDFEFDVPTNVNYANLSSLFSTVDKKALLARKVTGFDHEELLWTATKELYEPHGVDMIIPELIIPTEISRQYNEIKSSLRNHMARNFAAFITGERSLEEWDDFLGELEAIGINWYVGETQKVYDKMYK